MGTTVPNRRPAEAEDEVQPDASTRKKAKTTVVPQSDSADVAALLNTALHPTGVAPGATGSSQSAVDANSSECSDIENHGISGPVEPKNVPDGINPLVLADRSFRIKDYGYIPAAFIRDRLSKAANKTDVKAAHYPIATAPVDKAIWGGPKEDYLLMNGNKLVVGCLVRLLQTRWYDDNGGKTALRTRPAIRYKFLREADALAAERIVYAMSEPSTNPTRSSFWSGCLSLSRTKKSTPVPFRFVYDGTLHAGAKSNMKVLDATTLRPNDILYVEATVNRYERDKEHAGDPSHIPWMTWVNQLELHSITKLYKAPASAPDEPDSADERSAVAETDLDF